MRFKALLIVCMVTAFMLPIFSAYSIDPAPLLKLLKDVLDGIAVGDYSLSKELVSTALSVDLGDLNYVHRRTYLRLNHLLDLLITSNSLGNVTNATYLRSLIYDFYRTYHDLNVSITSYLNSIINHLKDPNLRDKYLSEVSNSLSFAYVEVDEVLSRLIERYLGSTSYLINVSIYVPKTILGGSNYSVGIYVAAPEDVECVDVIMYVSYGGLYTYLNTSIPTNENYTLILKAPTAEEFLFRGYSLSPELSYEVLVRVYGISNNRTYLGQTSARGVLKFLRPNLVITPKVVNNELASLVIESLVDAPLNASIYLGNELIATLELFRGVYEVPIDVELGSGKYLIRVITEARGPYLSSSWTYEVIKTPTAPEVLIDVSDLVLAPPFNTLITLHVSTTPYVLKLHVCGTNVTEHVEVPTKSLNISIPWSAFPWCDVEVVIEPVLANYSTVSKSTRIYVINLLVITPLMASTILLITTHATRRCLRKVGLFIPKLRSLIRVDYGASTEYVGMRFRESRISKLYRRLVGVLSKYVEPPKHSETLREFLLRAEKVVSDSVFKLLSIFISNYELELYSRRSPDLGYVRRLLKRLENALR